MSLVGCADDNPMSGLGPVTDMGNMSVSENEVSETSVPSGLVSVPWQGKHMNFWPYTGNDFTGTPQDPINLVLVGKVDPVQIRAALMALDGDRSAFGLPNVAISVPFASNEPLTPRCMPRCTPPHRLSALPK